MPQRVRIYDVLCPNQGQGFKSLVAPKHGASSPGCDTQISACDNADL